MSFGLLEKAVSSSHHSKFFEEGAERINRNERFERQRETAPIEVAESDATPEVSASKGAL